MRKKNKLTFGVGVNDLDEPISINKVHLPFYVCWNNMMGRCYSTSHQLKRPHYIGCSVCDEWKYLSNFKQWFDENYIEGFHLDKDILVEGNKVYSPEFCRFVPMYLNNLLTDARSSRGRLPLGVTEQRYTTKSGNVVAFYRAQCHNGNDKQLRISSRTVEEAQSWYSTTKKRIVKEQATKAFLENAIKTDVYLALVRRDF